MGGEVKAKTSSSAAAIGGGADNRAGSVSIEGGTVTAEATGKGPGIGNGYYGQNQVVRLVKGSVKATSTQPGVAAIGNGEKASNCSIVGADGTTPYLAIVNAPEGTSIKVNGEDWNIAKPHPEDDNVYLYLVNNATPYVVEVAEGEAVTKYNVTVKAGKVTVEEIDVTPPAVPTITEENGVVTVLAADEDTAVIEYSLDGENWTVYTEPVQVPEKATIQVRAKDAAGNVSEVVAYTVPDRTAPEAPVVEFEDGLTWFEYSKPFGVTENCTIFVRSIDEAGNISKIEQLEVNEENTNENLENLEALVEKAEKLDSSLYTSATWKSLELAIVNAKKVLAAENPSDEDILKAIEELEQAITRLEENKDDNNNENENEHNGGNDNDNNGSGSKPGTDLPQTGSAVGSGMVAMAGILASLAGVAILKRKREE